MTQLEKINEIIREYENGSDISAEDVLEGIKNVLEDTRTYRQEVSVETPAGKLCAYVGPDEDNPSVGLYMIPDGSDAEVDLCIAECKGKELVAEGENPKDISVYNWSDVTTEEWQNKFVLKRDDVVQALEIEEKPEEKQSEMPLHFVESELKKVFLEITKKYFPEENLDELAKFDIARTTIWMASNIENAILENPDKNREDILDMIKQSPCGEKILSSINFDKIEAAVEVRSDFGAALEGVENGSDLSNIIGYGFTNEDVKNLAQLHMNSNTEMREKIEDLLDDCNFHTEAADFADGNYSQYISSEIKGREDTSEKREPEL